MPCVYSDFPIVTHTLNSFTARATRLLDIEDFEGFMRLVLTGEYEDDNFEPKQVFLDPIQNLVTGDHPLLISRDYDSVIGFSEDILVEGPIRVHSVPHPTFALTSSIHLTRTLHYDGVSSSRFTIELEVHVYYF